MHTTISFCANAMNTLAHRMLTPDWFTHPWRLLALLLLGMPLVWAAGVSISNVKITTVKQIAFAETVVTVNAGSKITRTAVTQMSPGAVSYHSGNTSIATVDASTGEVTGVLTGETTITATQQAVPPYAQASASYTIQVIGNTVTFDAWALDAVPFGTQPYQIKAPTSNVTQAGNTPTIKYSTLNGDTSVVSITDTGTVTVKAKGTATIVAEQAPVGTFAGGTTQAVLEVTAIQSTFTWTPPAITLDQVVTLTDPSNSTNTAGAFSYAFKQDQTGQTIAEVNGKQLKATASGSGLITVTQAAAGNYDTTSIDFPFSVGLPTYTITGFTFADRTYDAVDTANNTFALPPLDKPAGSSQDYVFAIDPADAAKATIANGFITVLKPGTIKFTATLPQDPAVHQEATAVASLNVAKAQPVITLSALNRYTGDTWPFVIPVSSTNKDANTSLALELLNPQPAGFATLSQDAATKQWSANVAGAGTATLRVSQAENEIFVAGTKDVAFQVSNSATLNANTLTLSDFSKFTNDEDFVPPWENAVGDESLITVKVTPTSADTVATVGADGRSIALTGLVGTADIELNQPVNGNYQNAHVTAKLTVNPAKVTITGLEASISRAFVLNNTSANRFTLSPVKPEGSTATFKFTSTAPDVAGVDSNGVVTVTKPGKATLQVELSADPKRHEAATATIALDVTPAVPDLALAPVTTPADGTTKTPLIITSNSPGELSVTLEDQSPFNLATVAKDAATGQWYVIGSLQGTATIVVDQAASLDGMFAAHDLRVSLAALNASTNLQPNTLALAAISKRTSDAAFTPPWTGVVGDAASIKVEITQGSEIATVGSDNQTITLTGIAGTAKLRVTQPVQLQQGFAAADLEADLKVDIAPFTITGWPTAHTATFDPVDLNANRYELPTLAKPAGSQSEFTFSSDNKEVADIANGWIVYKKPGSANITAELPADPLRHDKATAVMALTVNKATPTITLGNVFYKSFINTDYITIPVSSNNTQTPIELTLEGAQPPDFATLNFNQSSGQWTATLLKPGKATLKAFQPASQSGVFNEATASTSIEVTAATLLDNPLALAPFSKFVDDVPFVPPWTGAASDDPSVQVKIVDANSTVAQVIPGSQKIQLTGTAGTAEVELYQPPHGAYGAKTVKNMLTVGLKPFAITGLGNIDWTYQADVSKDGFDLPNLVKPNESGQYVFTSDAEGVATITGQRVTVHKPGNAIITARWVAAGTPVYDVKPVSAHLVVAKATPVIALPAVNTHVGAGEVKINVQSSNTGTPISLSLVNVPASVAELVQNANGEWVAKINGVGSGKLVAQQVESADGRFAAGSAEVGFNVTATALAINPLALDSFDVVLGATPTEFLPPWKNPVGDTATITVTSSNPGVATIKNGQTIVLTGNVGDTELTLSQPATTTHTAASNVTGTLHVRAQAAPAVALYFTPDTIPKTYGDGSFTPALFVGAAGLKPTFSIPVQDAGIATVDSQTGLVTLFGAGTTTLTAQVSSGEFATTTATATLVVGQRDAGLSLGGARIGALGTGAFKLPLSTLSSGALSVTSNPSAVATAVILENPPRVLVTPHVDGNVELTIRQAPDKDHRLDELKAHLEITAPASNITWLLPKEIVLPEGAPSVQITLPAAQSSNQNVGIEYWIEETVAQYVFRNPINATTRVLNVYQGTKSVVLIATQAAGNGYAASSIRLAVPVVSAPTSGPAATTIEAAIQPVSVGSLFTIPYTTNSDTAFAPMEYTILEGDQSTIALHSVSSGVPTFIAKAIGSATVLLVQKGTETNSPGSRAVNITVQGSDPITGWTNPIEVDFDHDNPVIELPKPDSLSSAGFTYRVDPDDAGVARLIEGNRLQLLGAGEATLYAHQARDGDVFPEDEISTTLKVRAQPNPLRFDTTGLRLNALGQVVRYPADVSTFFVKASSVEGLSQGAIAYASNNPGVASIGAQDGLVTVKGVAGTATLTATQAAWSGFAAGQAMLTVIVEPNEPTLSLLPFSMSAGSQRIPPYVASDTQREVLVSVPTNQQIVTVGVDRKTLTAISEGTVRVTVTHPATATQASISAFADLNITAKVPTLTVAPASIRHTWTGTATQVTLVPTSSNSVNPQYTLTSDNPAVASVNGLVVTLNAPANGAAFGSTTLRLKQAASNGWGPAQVDIPVEVWPQPPTLSELTDLTRDFDEPDFELPATLAGQSVSYNSTVTTVAAMVDTRTVRLTGVGSTKLQARNASGALVKEVTLAVNPGDPQLKLVSEGLASTTLEYTMKASRKGNGTITYAIVSGDSAELLSASEGKLAFTKPGAVEVQATLAAHGNYKGATATASINLSDGAPGFVLTSWPTTPVRPGEEFRITYRANFVVGTVDAALMSGNQPMGGLLESRLPGRAGEEGFFRFTIAPDQAPTQVVFTVHAVNAPEYADQLGVLTRLIPVEFPSQLPPTDRNLGNTIVVTYDPGRPVPMPNTYDGAGNIVTGPDTCEPGNYSIYSSSNEAVLRQDLRAPSWQRREWFTMGIGETTISCVPAGAIPRPVLLKVIKASPALQSFQDLTIDLGQEYTLTPPSSLNKTGSWTYTIVNDDPTKPAATLENGKILPRNIGRAKIIATQAETAFYTSASIEANLEVKALAPTAFDTMYVTFGDPAFTVPRPGNAADTVTLTYAIEPADLPPAQQVASINSQTGVVTILKAGTTTIKAMQGDTVVARGTLVVDKAKTHLVFRLPAQSFFVEFCYGNWMSWPGANQPEDSATVKGLLQTNNPEGVLVYRGLSAQFGGPYNVLKMRAFSEESLRFPVWVEQLESENYYGARTEEAYYWANTNVTQCSQ